MLKTLDTNTKNENNDYITIREATLDDVLQITELKVKLANYHHNNLDKYYKLGNEIKTFFQNNLTNQIKSDDSLVVVADYRRDIIGYFIGVIEKASPYVLPDNIGNITDAYISPDFRRFGIGKKLFDRIVDWFKLNNIEYIEINPSANNETGLRAWKKYGFEEYILKMRKKI